ncbi:ATP-binding protein [Streptomyces rubradiris]|uniref:ATP-binding protein n=1 Tax=Streptomyces rubradiris TaxID=285531 RepID=A0ABQ3REZ1_STRRR|nr:ATP-binding protein [Streptomyces rubradiris]GHG97525.1 ATP-binding protein [Streptomyces rubradiris]GHI54439.1 ATP-binding protein [Streptomyces rubradiris]
MMKIAVSGTYSSGKTTTSIALAHLTGIPRTHAKTMREILPEALPGKRLEDCTAPELFQLGMRRYAERAVHESHLPDGFVSDGSSLHEWVYGKIRVLVGIHPDDSVAAPARRTPELDFFEQVIDNMGAVMKQHAQRTYDVFIHLPVEFPLVADGHRPVSERFRAMSDRLLLDTLDEYGIPYHVVGGSVRERLETIVGLLELPVQMQPDEAIRLAERDLAGLDTRSESDRTAA